MRQYYVLHHGFSLSLGSREEETALSHPVLYLLQYRLESAFKVLYFIRSPIFLHVAHFKEYVQQRRPHPSIIVAGTMGLNGD